jgi:hypothetical protein
VDFEIFRMQDYEPCATGCFVVSQRPLKNIVIKMAELINLRVFTLESKL